MNILTSVLSLEEYTKKRMTEIKNAIASATPEDKEGYKDDEYAAIQYADVDIEAEYKYYIDRKIEEYEAELKALNHKVYYPSISKFGFNNFKPFGNKIQTISRKPITLIYGPNSIGKSSLIHMSAYLRYIFKTKSYNLTDTDIFGDEINLGGFEKFIHKRDKNKTITFEFEFNNCSPAIVEYLALKPIDFTYINILSSFTKEEIIDIIKKSELYVRGNQACNSAKPSDRSNNNLCNKIYRNEFEYFNFNYIFYRHSEHTIDIVDYINGTAKFENRDIDFSISKIDKKLSFTNIRLGYSIEKLLNDYYKKYPYIKSSKSINYQFYGLSTNRDCFISEILIPQYINPIKYYLSSRFSGVQLDWEAFDLHESEIEYMAKNTVRMIKVIKEIFTYYNFLKSQTVPLKISMEIGHTLGFRENEFYNKPDNARLKTTKYFIDGVLYDATEEVIGESDDGEPFYYTSTKSYDAFEFKEELGYPNVLEEAPEVYKPLFYSDPDMEYLDLEVNSIFQSYKKGYNVLRGVFNDMINLKDMQYVGPLRFYPERETYFRELSENSTRTLNSKESWSLLKKDVALRDRINEWLKNPEKLKTPYEIKYRKLYDMESSLFKLDFKKFMEAKKTVMKYNQDIEEIKLKYMTEHEIQDYIFELAKKEEDNIGIYYADEHFHEIEKKVWYLKKFSELDEQEQYIQVFKEIGIFDDMESKEELVFEDLRNGTQISSRDLGLGISQILPVLIATNRNKNMTIAVEQPELHLHPAVQCEIADEFIRSYKENKNEFLIETHSEHLLLRIMKRMRHTAEDRAGRDKTLDLTPDDVCLLYVDSDGESTYIKELRLSPTGKLLDHWPNGFFEEGFKERFT